MVADNIKVHVYEGKYKTAANGDCNSFMNILRIFNVQWDIVACTLLLLIFKKCVWQLIWHVFSQVHWAIESPGITDLATPGNVCTELQ
jgi:hypothetical protein